MKIRFWCDVPKAAVLMKEYEAAWESNDLGRLVRAFNALWDAEEVQASGAEEVKDV